MIVQDPNSGLWADEAIITSIRPDGLSYELSSNGRTLLRSRKMLRPLPNFVRFTSPLLPNPLSSTTPTWDQASQLPNNPQLTTTPNQMGTSFETSTSPLAPLGSSLTGHHLVEEYPQSLSYASYSSRSGSRSNIIAKPTRRPDAPSYTSSSSSLPVITASMTNQHPKSPRHPSVRLPGIPCLLYTSPSPRD